MQITRFYSKIAAVAAIPKCQCLLLSRLPALLCRPDCPGCTGDLLRGHSTGMMFKVWLLLTTNYILRLCVLDLVPTTAWLTSFQHGATQTRLYVERRAQCLVWRRESDDEVFVWPQKKKKPHCSSDSTDGPNWKAASYVIDSHVHVHNGSLIAMGVPCEVECWSGKEKEIVETFFEHLWVLRPWSSMEISENQRRNVRSSSHFTSTAAFAQTTSRWGVTVRWHTRSSSHMT